MIIQDKRDAIAEVNPLAVVFDNPSFDGSIIGVAGDDPAGASQLEATASGEQGATGHARWWGGSDFKETS